MKNQWNKMKSLFGGGHRPTAEDRPVDRGRRKLLAITGAVMASTAIEAEGKNVMSGLAFVEDKRMPKRRTPIVPVGARSVKDFAKQCTSCMKCVEACPQKVLKPSSRLSTLMVPEMNFEHGYCKTNCTRCADVCADGAIMRTTFAEKSSTQIGHAVWVKKNCLTAAEGRACDKCARSCPSDAITMVGTDLAGGVKIPTVNTARCTGCGACENSCPSKPFSGIYVEGHEIHHTI